MRNRTFKLSSEPEKKNAYSHKLRYTKPISEVSAQTTELFKQYLGEKWGNSSRYDHLVTLGRVREHERKRGEEEGRGGNEGALQGLMGDLTQENK